jgi:CRISPR-associated protein Csm4
VTGLSGRWGLRVKLGKLGEELAASEDPFKRPLIMLTPGSAFYDSPVKEYYGRIVGEVSPAHPEVVQYGLALPVPILVKGDAK